MAISKVIMRRDLLIVDITLKGKDISTVTPVGYPEVFRNLLPYPNSVIEITSDAKGKRKEASIVVT